MDSEGRCHFTDVDGRSGDGAQRLSEEPEIRRVLEDPGKLGAHLAWHGMPLADGLTEYFPQIIRNGVIHL